MNLILDVETTGLIGNGKDILNWEKDYKRFPRIVSIAWKMADEITSTIVNQRGEPIPPGATKVNGVTDELAAKSEYTIDSVLLWLIEDSLKADFIIGHNLYFDTSVIKANALREFGPSSQRSKDIIKGLDKHKRIDIMRLSAKAFGGWNTLEKLHEKMFGCTPASCGLTS